MVLRFQRVTSIVSYPLTRPDDLGVTHGHSSQTDANKPYHYCRFPERSDVLPAAWRWEGVPRICPRLRYVPRLSAETQSHLSRWRIPDAPLALRPNPSGRAHHLASPVHDVSRGVHRAPALRLALSPDGPGGGPQRLASHAWRIEFGALRGHRSYLAHGPLSSHLCVRPSESGGCVDPVSSAAAHVCPDG